MDLEKLKGDLRQWQGGRGEPWDYTTSHSMLRVKLSHPQKFGPSTCAVLTCGNCLHVKFPSVWGPLDIAVEIGPEPQRDARLVLRDGQKFEIVCSVASVSRTLESHREIPPLFGE